ncbi:sugar transporter SWEET1-like [Eriocheir sinensis]|uniref:sugar transporter SWEET1-like n=1 Tax=Eriocheir sinensis TaxID=95602 RepID=UPI0021C9E0DD|nr:sugar transporter SWEET1-like [Eriocheir sinensis]
MGLEDYKDLISTVGTIVTIIQFLSGIDICRRIVRQGSTGDISGFPFVGGVFSTSTWLTYSLLLWDSAMSVTNAVGLSLQVIYLCTYVRYCTSAGPWLTVRRQIAVTMMVVALIQYYVFLSGDDSENVKTRVGLMCCLASIVFCASPLISLTEVFRTQSCDVLPFPLIFTTFLVTGLWWLYGIVIQNNFVKYPNLIGCAISGFQLLLFIVYPSKRKDGGPGDSRAV